MQWMSEAGLDKLEYKEFAGFPTLTGFFSTTVGSHLFVALYQYFATRGKKASEMIDVDSENFKCTFTLEEEQEALPEDKDSEGEDVESNTVETTVTA